MKNINLNKLRAGTALQALALLGTGAAGTVAFAAPAFAQDFTTGALVGSVTDPNGERVTDGTVTVVSDAQGFTRTAPLNNDGSFRVQALPIGTYTVSVTAPGQPELTGQVVQVNAGQNNTYTFALGGGGDAGAGEIVVTGSAQRGNDFGSNTGGLTIGNVSDLLNTTPVARNQTSLILLAPGATSGDTLFGEARSGYLASLGGGTVAENAYYVNGLNVTNFRTFVGSNNPPIEFYQSLDVKNFGLSAEFGRVLGGFTTAVTKSGSNQFKAGMLVSFAPDGLRSDVPNTYAAYNQNNFSEDVEANFYVSGPIIKDRLFFYGLYNPNYSKTEISGITTGQRLTRTTNSPFFGGKLDFIIADGHRLEGTYFRNKNTQRIRYDRFDPDTNAITDPLGTVYDTVGGDNFVVSYTGQFTNWFTLSGSYGENHDDRSRIFGPDTAYIDSTLTGTGTIASGVTTDTGINTDTRKFYRADGDIYVNLLGSHHFRFGYEREELNSTTNQFYPGGYRYTLAGPSVNPDTGAPIAPYIYRYFYLNQGSWDSLNQSYYLQDSWSLLNDRLTLQLGVRNDRFSSNTIEGNTYFKSGNQWGPRLGAAFDVFGDKRTTLRGSWSRYFMPVATNTNIRLGGAELYYRQRFAYPAGSDPSTFNSVGLPTGLQFDARGNILGLTTRSGGAAGPCPEVGPDAGALCSAVYDDGVPGPTDSLVSASLQPSYQDEWTIGAQHRIGEWDFSLTYINRRLGRTLDDVAIDAAVLKYCDANGIAGCAAEFTGFHQYVLANPGDDITVRLNGNCAADARQCDVVTLAAADLGFPKPVRKYDSIQFTFNKAYSNGWGIGGSYVYTSLKGNYEGNVKSDNGQDDAGLTQDFDQPGLLDGAYGTLANQRAHAFKLYGTAEITNGLRFGANLLLESPRKFSCIGVHPTDVFAQAYEDASFFCTQPQFSSNQGVNGSYLVPRGSAFKSDWRKQIDVNVQYDIDALPGSFVSVDVFNVFNFKSKTDYNEFGDNADGSTNDRYRLPIGYQTPRYVRFTLGLRFGETNTARD